MTAKELAEMRDLFKREMKGVKEDIAQEVKNEITLSETGGKKKVEWAKWITTALAVTGFLSAFAMFMFKTNAAADLEHQTTEATHKHDISLLQVEAKRQGEVQTVILKKLERLHTNQIIIGEKLNVQGLKNGDR